MQLILVLPGLSELRAATTAAVRAPALAHLIAMAGAPVREAGGIAGALAARYGVIRQADWPLAPIRLAALGVDPGGAFWLAADPVTLIVGRSDVRLAGVVDDLSRADADALVATLNAHFAGDGPRSSRRARRVFVRAMTDPLSTSPNAGWAARCTLPIWTPTLDAGTGVEMRSWHPVNVERERSGRAGRPLVFPRRDYAVAADPAVDAHLRHAGTWPLAARPAARAVPGDLLRRADALTWRRSWWCRAGHLATLERSWAPARRALPRAPDAVTLPPRTRDAVVGARSSALAAFAGRHPARPRRCSRPQRDA
jgi:hypothetical protein